MRPAAFVGLSVLLFTSHATAADPASYRAVVIDSEVKLRAGPSSEFPDTGTLVRGNAVVVEKDEGNGWLAVSAPYGSVSWVATQFIEDPAPDRATPKNVYVHAEEEVTLAAGKAGLAQPLDIRRVKVPKGTELLLLGPKVTFAGKTWYPVAPPAGDVRYLPKTAVQYEKPAQNNFVVRVTEPSGPPLPAITPTLPGASPIVPATGGVVASKPAVNHPTWTQAETAEREGRPDDAEKLYFELARLMNGPGGDHDIANLCYTRIHAIREKKRTGGNGGTTGMLQPPSKDERGVRPGAPVALPPATGPSGTITGANAATDQPKWTGPGTLRRSALTPDGTGRRAYALEDAPGVVKVYVIAGQGVDLEKYLNKRVDVYGVTHTRNGSKPYVIATAVEP